MVYEKREIDGVEVPPLHSRDREGRVCGRACVRNSSCSLPRRPQLTTRISERDRTEWNEKGKEEGDKKGL